MTLTEQKPIDEGLSLEKIEAMMGASSQEALPNGFSRLRLKKIVIQGFKSFAQKVQVDLTPGITAIVGPNGCGKSNIVDAIRWVLGEPNARNLRADAMQDVLFAGAQNEAGSNMAEVSLEFEGSFIDKPLIYDTFEVSRRLFRTGESEYRINQKMARLKDIHQLFADTGVGRNTFAIFEQGKIEQMVAMSYAQRRLIIEEAAGISGYKAMKKQALVKWEGIEETIKQLESTHDLLLERRERLQTQAARALEYKKLQEEIKSLEKAQLALQWHECDDQLQKITLDLKKAQNQFEELQKQNASLLELSETSEKALELEKVKLEPSQAAMMRDKELLLGVEYQEKSIRELHLQATKRLQEVKFESEKKLQKQKQLEESLGYLKRDIDRFQQQEGSQGDHKRILEREEQSLRSEMDKAKSAYEENERIERETSHQLALLEKELSGYTSRTQMLQDQYTRTQRELERETQSLDSLKANLGSIEEQKKSLESTHEQEKAQLAHLKPQLEQYELLLKEQENQERQLHLKLEKVRLDYQWLKDTCQDRSSISDALGWLEKLPGSDPLKISVRPFYEVLRQSSHLRLEHLRFLDQVAIARDLESAQEYLKRLQLSKISHFSVLVASELLSTDQLAQWPQVGLFIHEKLLTLMPQLESWQERNRSSGYQRWVKIEETWLRLDAAGILWSQPQRQSLVELESRLPAIEAEVNNLRDAHLQAKKALEASRVEKSALQVKVSASEKSYYRAHSALQELQARHEAQKESFERFLPRLEEKRQQLEPQLKQLIHEKEQLDGLKLQVQTAKSHLQEHSKALLDSRQKHQTVRRSWQEVEEKLRQCRRNLEMETSRHLQKMTESKFTQEQLEELKKAIEEIQKKYSELTQEVEALSLQLEASRCEIEPAKEKAANSSKAYELLVQELRLRQQEVEAIKRKQLQVQQEANAQEMAQQTLLARQEKVMWQRGRYEQEMEERFSQAIDMFDLEPVSISQLNQKLKARKKEMDEFGEVNFAAMRELEEIDNRKGLLDVQLVDIRASAQEVMRILATLDEKCKKQFNETFQRVDEAFRHNFTLLFEGGEAKLSLTGGKGEELDEDTAGVEVIACPPGKQLKSMMLMSGGEKCLTSVALMMALFEVRPAPFCLLDEIDAPLDDANVDRFLRLLRHYSHQTQVFIITHNKKTMAVAQTLLGVSMPKRGVSKLFMLDVETKTMRM